MICKPVVGLNGNAASCACGPGVGIRMDELDPRKVAGEMFRYVLRGPRDDQGAIYPVIYAAFEKVVESRTELHFTAPRIFSVEVAGDEVVYEWGAFGTEIVALVAA